eukprot:TRINITY_DN4667_c0_g2_i1.p1 TRINITY_DN4667_c0_g2~~TRINITY_DN4667_c0_g2_i1.p1  ORF type:complete len:2436 (-),score=509.81 TRINITY_DN4667_c0_g2_i1:272-7579(-)
MANAAQAAQAAMALSAMSGGGGGGLGGAAGMLSVASVLQGGVQGLNPIAMCTEVATEFVEDEFFAEAPEQNSARIAVPQDQNVTYRFRILAYSGQHLPREATFVTVQFTHDGNVRKFKSEVHPESATPVWEFSVNEDVLVAGSTPMSIEVHVHAVRWSGQHKLLGALHIPFNGSTEGPMRKILNIVEPGGAPMRGADRPKVLMCWQFALENEVKPELNRIAQLDDDAFEKSNIGIDVRILDLKLRKPEHTKNDMMTQVKVELIHNSRSKEKEFSNPIPLREDEETEAETNNRQSAKKRKTRTKEGMKNLSYASWGDDDGAGSDTIDGAQGWQWMRQVNENLVGLLSYRLKITAFKMNATTMKKETSSRSSVMHKEPKAEEETHPTVGFFDESIFELWEGVHVDDRKLWFSAELRSAHNNVAGHMQIEIDVFRGHPHRSMRAGMAKKVIKQRSSLSNFSLANMTVLPVRSGIVNVKEVNRHVTYFCTVWADNLKPGTSTSLLNPYVVVIMGSSPQGRGRTSEKKGQAYNIEWNEQIKLFVKAGERKARIQIWNKTTSNMGYGVDELLGEHTIYNVVPNKAYWCHCFGGALLEPRKEDEAMQMTKDAIRPASTYHGTVVVNFLTKAKVPQTYFPKLKAERKKMSLTLTLYRGLYLDHYANREVFVVVRLPGARLSNDNPNILSFPGKVDQDGVLRFIPDEHVRREKNIQKDDVVEWVARSTGNEVELMLCPNVVHAYLYIVVAGCEEEPPHCFGRLRLQGMHKQQPGEEEFKPTPTWKRMRYDISVIDPPKSQFQDLSAGYILGSGTLYNIERDDGDCGEINEEDEAGEDPSPREVRYEDENARLAYLAELEATKHQPKFVKPTSVLCRPCVGEYPVNRGSLGAKSDAGKRNKDKVHTVYCHMDVLAARNLLPLDEDGLLDPCFAVRVEDRQLTNPNPTGGAKSLDPLFLERICIPFEIECDTRVVGGRKLLEPSKEVPMPPVLFKMFDRDQNILLQKMESGLKAIASAKTAFSVGGMAADYEAISTIVVKDVKNFDVDADAGLKLDLNAVHQASWHALDKSARTEFNSNGIDMAWKGRPRALLAAGFSLRSKAEYEGEKWEELDDGFRKKISAERSERLKITVDLLGLRNIPASVAYPELSISSFWKNGAARVKVDEHEPRNPNFLPIKEDPESDEFRAMVNPILKIKGEGIVPHQHSTGAGHFLSQMGGMYGVVRQGVRTMSKAAAGQATVVSESEPDEGSDSDIGESGIDTVEIEDMIGYRICSPEYQVPVIKYLQTTKLDLNSDSPTVLMPDLVFQLRNSLIGTDYGTLSMMLPLYSGPSGQNVGMRQLENPQSWAEKSIEEHKNLPSDLAQLQSFSTVLNEDAYRVYIDVFSPEEGYLYWNNDFRMGRSLRTQEMFFIGPVEFESREEEASKSRKDPEYRAKKIHQSFNMADWTISHSKHEDEAFDHRFSPTLSCGESKFEQVPVEDEDAEPDAAEQVRMKFSVVKDQRHTCPQGPKALFADLYNVRTEKYKNKKIEKMTTKELSHMAKEAGWRAVTHQAAPEPINNPNSKESLKLNTHTFIRKAGHQIHPHDRDSCILARLRITPPAHALERWKWKKDEEKLREVKSAEMSQQFVVIQWDRNVRGTVIWAPPDGISTWEEAGSLLLAVKAESGMGSIVPILVPSFDLRFWRETNWTLRKTLKKRWRYLENRIKNLQVTREAAARGGEQEEVKKTEGSGAGSGYLVKSLTNNTLMKKKSVKGGDHDETDHTPVVEVPEMNGPDGHSKPIWVKKNAFVCRILKRHQTHNFDRPRTKNWYRQVLKDVFPEVATDVNTVTSKSGSFQDDVTAVKDYFYSRFMNLHHRLVTGEAQDQVGLIKGHVTIKRVKDEDSKAIVAAPSTASSSAVPQPLTSPSSSSKAARAVVSEEKNKFHPVVGLRPIQNLWMQQMVEVNVYVLTFRGLNKQKVGGAVLRPYLTCEINGGELPKQQSAVNENVPTGASGFDVYQAFPMTTKVPGATTLTLQVWNKGGTFGGDTLIGTTEIDLEDRHLLLAQRKMRSLTNEKFLLKRVCPLEIENGSAKAAPKQYKRIVPPEEDTRMWVEPSEPKLAQKGERPIVRIQPRTAPLDMLPIEAKDVKIEDDETGVEERVGTLRFWVDITPSNTAYTPARLSNRCEDFQVSVTIWGVQNISIFKDFGERNDVFVKGALRARAPNGVDQLTTVKTDVHKWARKEANFNWNWTFKVTAPTLFCSLELCLYDADTISENDPIYEGKTLNLDHYVMLAFQNLMEGKPALGTDTQYMVYDSWPTEKSAEKSIVDQAKETAMNVESELHRRRWWRRCCGRSRYLPKPKPAVMKIDVQILHIPEADRATWTAKSQCIAEPKGRVNMALIMGSPMRFAEIFFGPRNLSRVKKLVILLIVTFSLLIFLLITYYLMHTYLLPLMQVYNVVSDSK